MRAITVNGPWHDAARHVLGLFVDRDRTVAGFCTHVDDVTRELANQITARRPGGKAKPLAFGGRMVQHAMNFENMRMGILRSDAIADCRHSRSVVSGVVSEMERNKD